MFCWPNYGDIGPLYSPTLNGGSWSATLPLVNLQDRRLAKVARSSSAALADTRFRIDLKTDRFVALITVPKHSMSLAGKYRFLGVPSTLLFDYEAGDDIAAQGGTFTRSGTATYVDSTGVLRVAATDVPRDSHFINGVRTILLEGAGTNLCLQSENFGTTWVPFGTPTRVAAAHTAAGVTLDLLGDDDAAVLEGYQQAITFTGDGTKAVSVFVKQSTAASSVIQLRVVGVVTRLQATLTWSAGLPVVAMNPGTYYGYVPMADGVFRLLFAAPGVVAADPNQQIQVLPATTAGVGVGETGTLYVGGVQVENNPFPTSYKPTTTTTQTRNVDCPGYPIPSAMSVPLALTLVVKFIERGTILGVANERVLQIGDSASANNSLQLRNDAAGKYRTVLTDGAGVTLSGSTATVAPVFGDTVELRVTLTATGVIQIHQSINGAAEVSGAAGAAGGLPATWGAGSGKIFLDCFSTAGLGPGTGAYQYVRIAAGSANSLAAMRAIVYDSGWLEAYPPVYPAGSLAVGDPRLVTGDITAEEFAAGVPMPAIGIPATPFLGRYWSMQVDDSANVAGYVDLARLVVAGGYQPTINPNYGMKVGWEDSSVRQESDGGAAIFNVKRKRRVAMGVIEHVPDDEAWANPFEMMRVMGISEQIFFVLDLAPNSAYHLARRAFLCTLRELTALELVVGPRDGWPFAVTEEL